MFPGGAASAGNRKRLAGIIELEFVEARDVEIEIAVVIVVEEGEAEREAIASDAGGLGNVFEVAFAFVVKQRDATIEADGEIGLAVVVVVADGAAHAFAADIEMRGFGDVGKFAVAEIAEEAGVSFSVGVDEEHIGLAVAVVIEDAGAAAEKFRDGARLFWLGICWNSWPLRAGARGFHGRLAQSGRRLRGQAGQRRDIDEMHRNGRRNRLRRGSHQLRERIFSLFAVDEAHRLAEFFGGEVLEAVEMLDGARVVILAAVSLREAEFGGNLKGIQLQRVFECGNGFVVLLLLRIDEAEEILRVGVAGIESGGFLKIFDGLRRVGRRLWRGGRG